VLSLKQRIDILLHPELSIVMAENIDAMREWAKDRTVEAN